MAVCRAYVCCVCVCVVWFRSYGLSYSKMQETTLDLEPRLIWNLDSYKYQIMAIPKPVLKLCGRGIPPSDPIRKYISRV